MERGDALFILKAAPGPQDIGREILQVLGEGVLGLLCQRDAVHEEKHTRNRVGFDEPLDEHGSHPGLTGARGLFNEQLASPAFISLQTVSMHLNW